MVKNPILHKDGLPSSTCRIGLCPKGCSGSTARGYQLAGGLFYMEKQSVEMCACQLRSGFKVLVPKANNPNALTDEKIIKKLKKS